MDKKYMDGEKRGSVLLFALSTCGWCSKVKNLLSELKVAFEYVDVDKLKGPEKDEVMDEVKKHNPQCSFPTIVINDQCIVGFKEIAIREALGK
ncbi:MAG: glutaredoxin family protein [Candidatus Eremiobacteraeota bacterium]|nr:glutaredoxin family protein [Candidatus Eremiobacteraeota bacterium]